MANYAENDAFVRDLTDAAQYEPYGLEDDPDAIRIITDTPLKGSRAAMLALIDVLARKSLTPLSLTSILIAATGAFYMLNLPAPDISLTLRLVVWMLFCFGTLGFLTWKLSQFRSGLAYGGKPFSWRAHYTCGLGVMSFSLGTGAILLTPTGAEPQTVLIICGLVAASGITLGLGHLAHKASGLTASLPALALSFTSALFHLPESGSAMTLQYLYILGGMLTASFLFFAIARQRYRQLVRRAIEAHPRHEMPHIKARTKQASKAYNPFSIRLEGKSLPVAGEIPQTGSN
jgi:hypothetical protein